MPTPSRPDAAPPRPRADPARGRDLSGALLLALVAAEAALALLLTLGRRVPVGHDGFQFYTLQYYFLNGVAQGRGVPQWLPFMTQGTVANWWYFIQADYVSLALQLAGALLSGRAALPFYHLGMFFDQMVLLIGVWLLGRRWFASPWTAFFTALTVLGSTLPTTQPWFDLRFYHAVPLMLELLHRALDEGRWRWAALAGNLMVVQSFGNLPYFPPVIAFVVFVYLAAHALQDRPAFAARLRALAARPWRGLAAVALTGAALLMMHSQLRSGTETLVSYGSGRRMDGTVGIGVFLTYGLNPLFVWLDALAGVSPALDYHLFFGHMGAALALLSVAKWRDRAWRAVAVTAAVVFLFSTGGLVSRAAYVLWPMMRYYRHIGLVVPFVRLFLCLLAGFGFEALCVDASAPASLRRTVAAALGLTALWLAFLHFSPEAAWRLVHDLSGRMTPSPGVRDPAFYGPALDLAACGAAATALILAFLPGRGGARSKGVLIAAVVAVQGLALGAYKVSHVLLHTVSLDDAQAAVDRFSPMPYAARRSLDFSANPRFAALSGLLAGGPDGRPRLGTGYWSTESYLFQDAPTSPWRMDHWLQPYDDLIRAFSGSPFRDYETALPGWYYHHVDFPSHPGLARIAGVAEDKLQLFARAHLAGSDRELSTRIAVPEFRGGLLFVGERDGAAARAGAEPWTDGASLARDERLPLRYRVEAFDSDSLSLRADAGPRGGWLLYSEIWHPWWTATVDGLPTTVFKGDLAYQAVRLAPGEHAIRFVFRSRLLAFLEALFAWNGLAWIAGVAALFVRAVRPSF